MIFVKLRDNPFTPSNARVY